MASCCLKLNHVASVVEDHAIATDCVPLSCERVSVRHCPNSAAEVAVRKMRNRKPDYAAMPSARLAAAPELNGSKD